MLNLQVVTQRREDDNHTVVAFLSDHESNTGGYNSNSSLALRAKAAALFERASRASASGELRHC